MRSARRERHQGSTRRPRRSATLLAEQGGAGIAGGGEQRGQHRRPVPGWRPAHARVRPILPAAHASSFSPACLSRRGRLLSYPCGDGRNRRPERRQQRAGIQRLGDLRGGEAGAGRQLLAGCGCAARSPSSSDIRRGTCISRSRTRAARSPAWCGGNSTARLGLVPENGLEIIATGRISVLWRALVLPARSSSGWSTPAKARCWRGSSGCGSKLAAEGLFDAGSEESRCHSCRSLIGLVTSPQGAVLHDIRTTIAATVSAIAAAVAGAGAGRRGGGEDRGGDHRASTGARGPAPQGATRPDLLIVARGGGSLEDLMAFSDEAVLRAVAACSDPGDLGGRARDRHDADRLRVGSPGADTPTAAAEIAVPARVGAGGGSGASGTARLDERAGDG